ncbi:uncharacterized protein LOC113518544 [Galleria mellonella]|uniref:Uncharacterized protein LOC113518544 n=1 Tax=Galleria mellonella TaxID=7137 RepID=A0ABM3N6F1_GALME|nr:uncharacterized protein LOC113518544 [Galleria mellonella]
MNYRNSLYLFITSTFCWQYFTSLQHLTLQNSVPDPEYIHSEYFFGNCKRKNVILYTHVHLDHMDVLGKIIIRGWIDIIRIPICIILRATSYETDMFRSTAYNFQMCVPRITYCHSKRRFKYHYYEWYLPYNMVGGMNWDLYFYGSPSKEWQ